jgi:hypothetical protein
LSILEILKLHGKRSPMFASSLTFADTMLELIGSGSSPPLELVPRALAVLEGMFDAEYLSEDDQAILCRMYGQHLELFHPSWPDRTRVLAGLLDSFTSSSSSSNSELDVKSVLSPIKFSLNSPTSSPLRKSPSKRSTFPSFSSRSAGLILASFQRCLERRLNGFSSSLATSSAGTTDDDVSPQCLAVMGSLLSRFLSLHEAHLRPGSSKSSASTLTPDISVVHTLSLYLIQYLLQLRSRAKSTREPVSTCIDGQADVTELRPPSGFSVASNALVRTFWMLSVLRFFTPSQFLFRSLLRFDSSHLC